MASNYRSLAVICSPALLPYVCFPFLCWVKFWNGCFREVFFFIWETKKWSLVTLDRWLSYTVTVVWGFALTDLSLVLDKWLPSRGGCLNRFDRTLCLGLVIALYYLKIGVSMVKCFRTLWSKTNPGVKVVVYHDIV